MIARISAVNLNDLVEKRNEQHTHLQRAMATRGTQEHSRDNLVEFIVLIRGENIRVIRCLELL